MKKGVILYLFVTVILSLSLLGCNEAAQEQEAVAEELLTVDTIGAEKGSLVISESFMGVVSAEQELKVYPRTAGEVTSINVKAGDYVNAGDVLFQLNDEFAQLDLKSAKTNLSKTQAEVKKSQGSEEVLTQQKEWQALENQNSKIADSNTSVRTAREDYDRQVHYLGEAQDKENEANEDYKKAEKRYDKAKDIRNDYEDLQKEEKYFEGRSLEEAAGMTTAEGPTQAHIDEAKRLLSKVYEGDSSKLYPEDVTPAGVAALKSTKDSLYNKYSELKSARESQEDKVTSAKRAADKADKTLQDEYTSYRQDVDNMLVRDISLQADNKRIQQIDVNASSINVEKAEQSLEQYTVTAPISGVIGKVGIKQYEFVSTGTEALLIENTDNMKIEFSVTEEIRNNLYQGQTVTIENGEKKITGQVIEIPEVADEQSGMFKIKAQIPGTAGILSGSRVSVVLDSYVDNSGFVIPNDAVYHANGKAYVFVAQNGQAVRKDVVTGMFDGDSIVVSEGLDAGERVITSWNSALKEGVKIKENPVKNPVVSVNTQPEKESAPVTADAQIVNDESENAQGGDDAGKPATVKATTTVFIRSTPDKNSNDNKLGKAKAGDEFTMLGEEDGWTKVLFEGSEAFIKSDYLTKVDDGGEAE